MSDMATQLRNIARVLRKGFAGHLAFDSAECQGMAESLATAANELERAERILAALREPSVAEAEITAMADAVYERAKLRAVAAAEREVGRE